MLLYHSFSVTRNGKFMHANVVCEYGAALDAFVMNMGHLALCPVVGRIAPPALHPGRHPDYFTDATVSMTLGTFQAPGFS